MFINQIFEGLRNTCKVCGQTPCNCTHIAEEKVRLDPKCWKGKKIGNPKTKMKGGVRVNNCVPAESVEESADPQSRKLGRIISRIYNEIYEMGDDALDYLNDRAAVWAELWDRYEGDIDSIIAEEDPVTLGKAALELKDILNDLQSDQGVAEGTIHVGYRNSSGDWIKTTTHDNYRDAKAAMERLVKRGKKGVQHRYDNKGNIDPGAMMTAKPDSGVAEGLGKDIDYTSLELDGVHEWDRPDYSDAYFSYGEYIDGTPLPDEVLDQLSSDGDLLRKHIENSLYEGPITPVAPVINPAKVQVQPKQNVYTPSAKGGSGGAVNVGKKSPAAIIDIQTPLVHEDNNDLVDFIFAELEQQFPDVVSKFGHEVVGDAIADTAVFYQDAEDDDIRAMVQQVVNTLQHRSDGQPVQESRLYYNTIGTPSAQLRSTFKMRKDRNGWFLKEDAAPKIKLEALRAFGSPALKEYDLSAFTGGTQTQGPDNVVSPVGSVPKTQRKKVKKNG